MAISYFLSAPASQARSIDVHAVATGSRPAIAADGSGHLYAAFQAYVDAKQVPDIYCAVSTNGGATWTAPKDISNTPGVSGHPDIAVEKNGAIDVVWNDNSVDVKSPDIFFARSTDQGKTWTTPLDISNTSGVSAEPALALGADDSIHVVWTDTSTGEKDRDIYYACSRDSGKKFAKDPLLPAIDISNTPGSSSEPTIAVAASGVIHVAWTDTTPDESHPDIYYVRGEKDSWTKSINVSNSKLISSHPALACDKENVFLAWSDNSLKEDAAEIWLAIASKSDKFAEPVNLSETKGASIEPAAAASNGRLAVVWSDTTGGVKTLSIYARGASVDSGGDFSEVIPVSNPAHIDKHPHVTIAGGKMVVIWEEVAGGGEESTIKVSSTVMKGLATLPATPVDPRVHGKGNQH